MSNSDLFAVPLLPLPIKLSYLLDKLCEHRPWFSDFLWEDPAVRRTAANARIADAYASGFVWEVYRGPALVGILVLDSIVEQTSASCHFVFFDKTLGDKLDLCRSTMELAFNGLNLQTLRAEIPLHVKPLVKFCRKLGFRYESEVRDPVEPDVLRYAEEWAAIGSRKRHAMRYQGEWVDSLLLSISREEFQRERSQHNPSQDQHGSHRSGHESAERLADRLPEVGPEPLRERDPA